MHTFFRVSRRRFFQYGISTFFVPLNNVYIYPSHCNPLIVVHQHKGSRLTGYDCLSTCSVKGENRYQSLPKKKMLTFLEGSVSGPRKDNDKEGNCMDKDTIK